MVHPWRLTWNIVMEVWKIIFLSKWVICRFHVNLPGCTVDGRNPAITTWDAMHGTLKIMGFQLPITSTGWPDFFHHTPNQYDLSLKGGWFCRRLYPEKLSCDISNWKKSGQNVHSQEIVCLKNDKSLGRMGFRILLPCHLTFPRSLEATVKDD